MKDLLSSTKGAKAFDFLTEVKFDINKLSAENFRRLTIIIDKYGVNEQLKDFFGDTKDVNRMLTVLENYGKTLADYTKLITKIGSDLKMFSGTITISGNKMKFSEFFSDINDAYSYYHKVGTKYRYISKFHKASETGLVIMFEDGAEFLSKVVIIKTVKEIREMFKYEEKD